MPVNYRRGTPDDSYAAFQVFLASITDLSQRQGVVALTGGDDPAVLAELWERRKSLYDHLARTAEHFWVAESEDGMVGYARSIVREGHLELTEFFVHPGKQSQGVGKNLLSQAFPPDGYSNRTVIASSDTRAQVLYMKNKVYPRFPIMYFSNPPEATQFTTDLTFQPMTLTSATLEILAQIDEALLGYRRDADHQWLASNREGFIYQRQGKPAGYGYVGYRSGPFALLQAADIPAALAHADGLLVGVEEEFGVEVPLVNRTAIDYLLGRGFELASFTAMLMSDRPFGNFESYICTAPPFFL
jgi:GNAT superfamily N-acetyltransferase